jgi:hypothetical protein
MNPRKYAADVWCGCAGAGDEGIASVGRNRYDRFDRHGRVGVDLDVAASPPGPKRSRRGGPPGSPPKKAVQLCRAQAILDKNYATASRPSLFDQEGYIGPDYVFTAGGMPTNAVRAEVTAVVNNILLDAIGAPVSTVKRDAIATLSGLGSGIPTLPVVIGDCHYDTSCEDQNCMPLINQAPDHEDNTAWTGFSPPGAPPTSLTTLGAGLWRWRNGDTHSRR